MSPTKILIAALALATGVAGAANRRHPALSAISPATCRPRPNRRDGRRSARRVRPVRSTGGRPAKAVASTSTSPTARPSVSSGCCWTVDPSRLAGTRSSSRIGTNGRACVTCHQPADAHVAVGRRSIQRALATPPHGKDPLFAPVDGCNCPDLPAGDPASHSLLLERGPVPGLPAVAAARPPTARRSIRSSRSRWCAIRPAATPARSTASTARNPMVSVYRRPRVVANMKYVTHQDFGVGAFVGKNGLPSVARSRHGQAGQHEPDGRRARSRR